MWNLKQKQEKERLQQSRRMIKNELDQMVHYQHQKKDEVKVLDKLYGQAFAAKVAQEEQKHADVSDMHE